MPTAPSPAAVIVDPFSSGAYLAARFRQAGWDCVAVLSSRELPANITSSLRPEAYVAILDAEQGLPAVLRQLQDHNVAAVLPGCETGVELADAIGAALGTPGNGTTLSGCRRDKAAMGVRLRACGIPAAEQVLTRDETVLVDWAARRGKWPVVVKPTRSSGSDGVAVCHGERQVREAFRTIFDRKNKLGGVNDAVLGQEFLEGQQYLVNTVSVQGQHFVGEIWRFDVTVEPTHQVYDRQLLLPPNGALQDQLVSYACRVLDALCVKQGAAHTEVMATREGPRLIECAARMTGLIGQRTLLAALGHHHLSLCADCYLAPDRVLAHGQRYELRGAVGIVALRAPFDGQIRKGPGLRALLDLPTFSECIGCALEPGSPVRKTVDLFTCPGLVYLHGDTGDQLECDTAAIRRIEASHDLYEPA